MERLALIMLFCMMTFFTESLCSVKIYLEIDLHDGKTIKVQPTGAVSISSRRGPTSIMGRLLMTQDHFEMNGFSFNPSRPLSELHALLQKSTYKRYVKSVQFVEREETPDEIYRDAI